MEARSLESTYLLSAILEQQDAPELRTAAYSRRQLTTFLKEDPAAITLAPPGTGNAERLFDLFLSQWDVFHSLLESHRRTDPWLVFAERANELLLQETIQREELASSVQTAAQRLAGQTIVVIRLTEDFRTRLDTGLKVLRRLTDTRSSANGTAHQIPGAGEGSDREELMRVRKDMLQQAGGTLSSEDLALAAQSTTTNSSQLAADQRGSGKLFGVRWGREWRYPTFQFDATGRVYPEMKDVLTALSPDIPGWDRLQWFLRPHEALKGSTPLQAWKADRRNVIKAANTERWNGRD
ncbi:MAG: hypothetical protein JSR66_10915 [Proteobacteria bacterium]|nr:hypothetical protein [Pseudomonadota bacterium]